MLKCILVVEKLNNKQLSLQSSVSHDPSEIIVICWFGAQASVSVVESSIHFCHLK